jgi:DDE superfamily endonuclease
MSDTSSSSSSSGHRSIGSDSSSGSDSDSSGSSGSDSSGSSVHRVAEDSTTESSEGSDADDDLDGVFILTGDEIMRHGLLLLGYKAEQLDRQSKHRREKHTAMFKGDYGASPQVVARIFEDLQTTNIPSAKIHAANMNDASHLLYTLAFMKSYPTEQQRANKWHLCDRLLRDNGWDMMKRLQALKATKIVWPTEAEIGDQVFIGSIDGTHVKTNEPNHPDFPKNTKAFSYKNKAAGLSYEIVLSLSSSKIIWMNGPFLASVHDAKIFKSPGGLKAKLQGTGLRLIADSGYGGKAHHQYISQLSSHDSPEVTNFKVRARMRHEGCNGRLKTFRIIDSARFRHGQEKFKIAFEACAVVTNYKMEISEPLFDV